MRSNQLYNYAALIEKFLSKEINAHDFERTFLDIYLEEKAPMSEDLFRTLDDYINEDQLRNQANRILEEIRELQRQGRMTE